MSRTCALPTALFVAGVLAAAGHVAAQGTGTPRGTLQAPTVNTTLATAPTMNTAMIQRFRAGLQVSGAPQLPTSGPSPLVSVMLNWPAYPGATAYEVLRQAFTGDGTPYPLVPVATAPLRPPPTSTTVSNIPPYPWPSAGWSRNVQFRVVAIVSGRAVDTTASVSVQLPQYHPQQNSLVSSAVWPPPTTAAFAAVGARLCQITGTSGKAVWARNPAAASYTVDLVQNRPVGYVDLGTQSTTDTTMSPTLPAGADLIMVRPEFSVHDWPALGETSVLHGEWVYLGTAHSPAPSGAPVPCSQR